MDLLVAAHRVHESLFVAGETRRIEDDQVVLRLGVFEEIEDIVFDHIDVEAVEFRVVASRIAGSGGDIDGSHFGSPGFRASESEAALVGEAVEHAFALGELGDFGVGLKLIEIKPGFLAVEEVDFEIKIVGSHDKRAGVFAVQHFDAGFHALGLARWRIIAQHDRLGIEQSDQSIADQLLAQVHRQRERLDRKMIAVAVDDQARDAVRFAPNDSAEL